MDASSRSPAGPTLGPFVRRHIGSDEADQRGMLAQLGYDSLDALTAAVVPSSIALEGSLDLPAAESEASLLSRLRKVAARNSPWRSFIGTGYSATITPAVIRRNVLENPGFYTQYTPYQAEIAQGRLELLLNFQTMVGDLTGLPVANASLLDEGTAAAEAMTLCVNATRGKRRIFFVSSHCHPQTIAVVRTRAEAAGIEIVLGDEREVAPHAEAICGALLQYPATDGSIVPLDATVAAIHAGGALAVVATDLLALTLLKPPGEALADVAIGSTQRFGVPMSLGGPHAAFLATRDEYKRQIPGRIVGVSHDAEGQLAYRLAIQTREQHIRRDRATSNICTAQVLLAIIASLYASYHGPDGLRAIAERVRGQAQALARALSKLGFDVGTGEFFDTLRLRADEQSRARILDACAKRRINLRVYDDGLGISLDEATTRDELATLASCFAAGEGNCALDELDVSEFSEPLRRTTPILQHPVFRSHSSEHELARYIQRLQNRDLSLTTSMIPLGSCTMKLNASAELEPISWPEFSDIHPHAPPPQWAGYQELFDDLASYLAEITGFEAVSLQPNSGAQGEYAGLLAIRAYHRSRRDEGRTTCLIPTSAHGTNPASAVMAGLKVVAISCDDRGNVDLRDLRQKAEAHRDTLAALMLTYPSTHGVFEPEVREICRVVHECGGQVYLDGANMNAQVGLCRPGDYGADVCHLNLHKTFCIPHGGGGPGVGPIAVAPHLVDFLPRAASSASPLPSAVGPVSAAPFGSPGVLPIPWMYIRLMGPQGLRRASQVAILNANYMAKRLSQHFPILYSGPGGRCAHEFIVDARPYKKSAGVEVDDIAKRLMDYGFHAPTMSFPVPGTLMIEPTESEPKAELDRFCDAMIAIRGEISEIEAGTIPLEMSPLRRAPHTARAVTSDAWDRPYSRQRGAFPTAWTFHNKFWPAVARIDNAAGDRHLVCTCPSVTEMADLDGAP